MTTRPKAEKPKGENVTLFITDDLRKRVDKLRKTHFSAMQINQFTAYLVEIGIEEEETRFKEKEISTKARLERAAVAEQNEKQGANRSIDDLIDDVLGENIHNLPYYVRAQQAIAVLKAKAEIEAEELLDDTKKVAL